MVIKRKKRGLIQTEGICKSFNKIIALHNINIELFKGEIIGLVGDNGAGKSTLIKIFSGVYRPDNGKIYFNGKLIQLKSVRDARLLGIETMYQDHSVVPDLPVAQNIFLAREIFRKFGSYKGKVLIKLVQAKLMEEKSKRILEKIGLSRIDPSSIVRDLSGGERQAVAYARSKLVKAKLLLLDEPTTHLSLKETYRFLKYVKQSKKAGVSSIFVTHVLSTIYPICDRFVCLYRGRKIADVKKEDITQAELARLITEGKSADTK